MLGFMESLGVRVQIVGREHAASTRDPALRSTSRVGGAVGSSWHGRSHQYASRGAGVMAPSVDKSVVVLCRDGGGLWAPSVPSVPSVPNHCSSGPCQAQRFLP